jgi:hypothetical protein
MTKPDIDALIKALGVRERIFLFCLASGTGCGCRRRTARAAVARTFNMPAEQYAREIET